jgi:hypothetical protein
VYDRIFGHFADLNAVYKHIYIYMVLANPTIIISKDATPTKSVHILLPSPFLQTSPYIVQNLNEEFNELTPAQPA